MEYSICNDYIELISGTRNSISPAYMEAAKNIAESTPEGLAHMKNFITNIEQVSKEPSVRDPRISSTNGNIKNFKGYEDIETTIQFMEKHLGKVDTIADCVTVFNTLKSNQPIYTEGYTKQVRLIILEYENALYLLVTSLSMVMANTMEVVSDGKKITVRKKSGRNFGIIARTIKDLAKEISTAKHKEYLEYLLKSIDDKTPTAVSESVLTDVKDTLEIVGTMWGNVAKLGKSIGSSITAIRKSLFGIVPLIRSVVYLRYKKKADTIVALEQQAGFIKRNIEQLQNITTMDPVKKKTIIRKQQAVCEQYMKKAEKLRAELCEAEKAASTAINKSNPDMKKTNNTADDDFVLEAVGLAFGDGSESNE